MKSNNLRYYSRLLLRGSIVVSIAQAASRVVSFIVIPVFTYYLSPEEYGIVSMAMIVVTILSLAYNPGMMSATTRMYHDTDSLEERQELIGSAYRFFIFVPIVFMIIGIFIGPYIFSLLFSSLSFFPYGILALILAFLSQPKRIWILLMTLQHRIKITAIFSFIAVSLGAITSIVLVVLLKLGAIGKFLGVFPSVILYFLVSFRAIKKYTNGRWSFASIKKQLIFGFPIIPAIWSYEILHVADRYILERMTSMTAVGLYTFGYQIAEIPMLLALGIRQLWNPIFYENMNNERYDIVSKLVTFYVLFISAVLILVILFNKEIIVLLMNERYFEAIPIIGIIVIGIYFNGLLTITNSMLSYKNKFSSISKIALLASTINIGLNIIFIPILGIKGAALATAISYFIYLLIGIFIEFEFVKIYAPIKIFAIPTILLLFAYTITSLFPEPIISYFEIILKVFVLIIYVAVVLGSKLLSVSEIRNFSQSIFQRKINK